MIKAGDKVSRKDDVLCDVGTVVCTMKDFAFVDFTDTIKKERIRLCVKLDNLEKEIWPGKE